ncbi:hypothetical protein [Fictibacillus phosphorivorans]|nr:hypothetical protein [Fictibacillus phosphorivorans]MCM3718496.1 hypothetical protein [Fictibacillus phosphorivorans]MCM3776148.1 hypothetical protein [Fictibacillus phosphorivorans]
MSQNYVVYAPNWEPYAKRSKVYAQNRESYAQKQQVYASNRFAPKKEVA